MEKVVTFGEIMARMNTREFLRFRQALPGELEVSFAGAEANVAASIVLLGGRASFVTALPKHQIADACLGFLNNIGVDTSEVIRTGKGRLGIYFVETGANQRPSNVIYDRDHASIAETSAAGYDWKRIFDGASWFHVTGITPALSKNAAEATLDAVMLAKKNGLVVSCDLNFRKKLWTWEEGATPSSLAGKVMRTILPHVDILIANEEDAQNVLGIEVPGMDADSGSLEIGHFPELARQISGQFPNIKKIAITLRESISATCNNWGGMLYDCASNSPFFAPLVDGAYHPYPITSIVDRIGGGDSFAGALIFAMLDGELGKSDRDVVAFAAAASCLCHSIRGDFNFSTRDEVLALMRGSTSGRINR